LETTDVRVVASDIRLDFEGAAFTWSPDSLRLAFRNGGVEERTFDCYVVRRDGGRAQTVSGAALAVERPIGRAGLPFWDTKGDAIYFLHEGILWRSLEDGNKAEKVAEIPGRRIVRFLTRSGNLLWISARGEAIVLTHDDLGKQDGFYSVDLKHG